MKKRSPVREPVIDPRSAEVRLAAIHLLLSGAIAGNTDPPALPNAWLLLLLAGASVSDISVALREHPDDVLAKLARLV